jgi:predicted MPP superfamily phosphohydrolase
VMHHHPASFAELPARSAPFAVAGHTHGGQVRLPLAPLTRHLTYAKEVKVMASGWIHDARIDGYGQEGNDLYVSRGIGCSVVPMRLFCRPELTLFTLKGAG